MNPIKEGCIRQCTKNPLPIITFSAKCDPPKLTHQSSLRVVRAGPRCMLIKSLKGKQVEKMLNAIVIEHKPKAPLQGPVKLAVQWTYPWRKSEPKKNRKDGNRYCDTKPDCDNLLKFLCDAMENCGYFEKGDSQIAEVTFSKFWGDESGIVVNIYGLSQ